MWEISVLLVLAALATLLVVRAHDTKVALRGVMRKQGLDPDDYATQINRRARWWFIPHSIYFRDELAVQKQIEEWRQLSQSKQEATDATF